MSKILIIDDSLLDRKLLAKTIQKAELPHDILQAADGQEGLSVLSANYQDVQLILLDWQMPNMDGIAFMEAIKDIPHLASIPIIMVSASGAEESQQYAKRVNPNLAAYVVKPYKPDALIAAMLPYVKKD